MYWWTKHHRWIDNLGSYISRQKNLQIYICQQRKKNMVKKELSSYIGWEGNYHFDLTLDLHIIYAIILSNHIGSNHLKTFDGQWYVTLYNGLDWWNFWLFSYIPRFTPSYNAIPYTVMLTSHVILSLRVVIVYLPSGRFSSWPKAEYSICILARPLVLSIAAVISLGQVKVEHESPVRE